MKNTLTKLLFIVFPIILNAQVTYELSADYQTSNINSYGSHFVNPKLSKNIITVKRGDNSVFIETFDLQSMDLVGIKEYKDFPKNFSIQSINSLNNKLYCFYSLWNRKKRQTLVYAREIDIHNGTFKDLGKVIITMEGEIYSLGFQFHYSRDNSKLLIQAKKWVKGSGFKVKTPIVIYTFEGDLKQLYSKEIYFPYVHRRIEYLDFNIDKKGNVYVLAETTAMVATDNNSKSKSEKKIQYELFTIPYNSSTPKSIIINSNYKTIHELKIYEGKENELICTAFYKHNESYGGEYGIFIAKINTENEEVNYNHYSIPFRIANQNRKDALSATNFESLKIKELSFLDDGSLLFIGEEYVHYASYNSATTRALESVPNNENYHAIFIAKINKNNELSWMKKLPKNQSGNSTPGGLSFKYFFLDGNHHFVYMDNIKNLTLKSNEYPAKHIDERSGYLMQYKVSHKSGKIEKEVIFDTTSVKGSKLNSHCTSCILQLSENELLLNFSKEKKKNIKVILTF